MSTPAARTSKQTPKPQVAKPRGGRPRGAKTADAPVVVVAASRCQHCGSTQRGPYLDRNEQAFRGLDEAGQPYTHIIRRRVRCTTCGRMRIDRTHENHVGTA